MFAQPPQGAEYVSIDEAAEILRCTTRFIRKLISSGELPAYKVGVKMVRLRRADVASLLKPMTAGGDAA